MSAFAYRAVDNSGRLLKGELAASSEAELDSRLLQIGLQLVTCKPLTGRQHMSARAAVGRRELINFCFHLEQAQKAGLPILEALKDLRDSTADNAFRNVLASISLAVEGGKGLSDAMADFPATFDRVFVALIRAGERSGELAAVLGRMTETLKWQDELVSQTKKLVMYPAFVGVVVVAVVFFLMVYVVPQMSEFLKTMGQEMPIHTRALIATSDFIVEFWYLILALPTVLVVGIRWLIRTDGRVRRAFDGYKLRAPLIGPILNKIIMSRFATYFQIMYASGIPIVDGLRTARELTGNIVVSEALDRVSGFVAEGNSLSGGIAKAELFPPLVVRMVRMGEDIGKLDEALQNVSYFYNREVGEAVDRLQTLIEPAMTVVLGLILGWVMLSVLGPIYDTIGTLGAS
ncbi:MAG: type II secretion system F family protein [Gammaproteobacteria bacterium]|nr:type II secretion system F family protein [Gammaproteobacteria bacterium]